MLVTTIITSWVLLPFILNHDFKFKILKVYTKILNIMPYYGWFSHNLHIIVLRWRLSLCTLLLWRLVHTILCSMTNYDIRMVHDIARDAYCNITMGNDIVRDIHCDITMSKDISICTSQYILMLLWSFVIMYC